MRVIIPPLVGFIIAAAIVWLHSLAHPYTLGDMGDGNAHAFMACFRYCWPLYFLTAVVTQALVIVPVWNAYMLHSKTAAFITFVIFGLVCAAFAGGVAYIIWDKRAGFIQFSNLATTMLMIQLGYWTVIFIVMFLLSGRFRSELHIEEAE